MTSLPTALQPFAAFKQFMLWTTSTREGKLVKLPCDLTGQVVSAHDPQYHVSADEALAASARLGDAYGLAFSFTDDDNFFFVDLDHCLVDGQWSPVAQDIMRRLSGAAIEVSQSGTGLHIFGKGLNQDHASKNIGLGLELYHRARFVALTGNNMVGSADHDCTLVMPALVADYFPLKTGGGHAAEWTTEPVAEYSHLDDAELLKKALGAKSAAAAFTGYNTFRALWEADETVLGRLYPDSGERGYDSSSADSSLAVSLLFWTGRNCERVLSLMKQSALVREKWEREDYLERTILSAMTVGDAIYSLKPAETTVSDSVGAAKLKGSPAQVDYAASIREAKLAEVANDPSAQALLAKQTNPKLFLDNQTLPAAEIAAIVTPVETTDDPLEVQVDGPKIVGGFQYLGATQQIEFFDRCVYIQDIHRVFTPNGVLLKADQFNATYGGYSFQIDEEGSKTTRKAWEALTESQVVRYTIAESMCFRPDLEPGALVQMEHRTLVNTYVPVATTSQAGDVTPFLAHLRKLLPVRQDRLLLVAYMAACVQHIGVKFQWAPLVQGVPGNGKTLLSRCVSFAIGERYTHFPPAMEIAEKFNAWLFNKLFIGVEDVYVPEHKKEVIEVLKPMITNSRLARRAMGQDQEMHDVCANFMLNSNHKDAIRKTEADRRFAVFYCAQQTAEDLHRDGMMGDYFPDLYEWLDKGGYAAVNHYLRSYVIPNDMNPAKDCHRAPETSSTKEAIDASMGSVEQEILEAIDEDRQGFAGGWVSSVAVERLLHNMGMVRAIPHNKRRDMLQSLGYDWHPSLRNGRTNNAVAIDEGKKPRLFIIKGHKDASLTKGSDIVHAYEAAQKAGGVMSPAEVAFNNTGRV